MELSLPFGPWKEIASSEWNGVPTSLYMNSDKIILVVAFPQAQQEPQADESMKEDARAFGAQKPGVLVLMKKPLVVEGTAGTIEKFLQNQKRDLTFVEKTVEKKRFRYLILEAKPFFIEFRKEELAKAVKEQYGEIEALARITSDVAANYGCKTRGLDEAEEAAGENLLGDPLSLFLFGGVKSKLLSTSEEKKMLVGFGTENRDAVEMSAAELQTVLVFGKDAKNRLKAMQVCAENLLAAGIPCLILAEGKNLKELGTPSPNSGELDKAGLKPASFPVKEFEVGKGFFLDLRFVSPPAFEKLFFPASLSDALKEAWGGSTIREMREKLDYAQDSPDGTKYESAKANRIFKLIEKQAANVFGQNSGVSEIKRPWKEKTAALFFYLGGTGAEEEVESGLRGMLVESVLNCMEDPPDGEKLALIVETGLSKLPPAAIERIEYLQDKAHLVLNDEEKTDAEVQAIAPSLEIDFLDGGPEFVGSFSGVKKKMVLRPTYSASEPGSPLPEPEFAQAGQEPKDDYSSRDDDSSSAGDSSSETGEAEGETPEGTQGGNAKTEGGENGESGEPSSVMEDM